VRDSEMESEAGVVFYPHRDAVVPIGEVFGCNQPCMVNGLCPREWTFEHGVAVDGAKARKSIDGVPRI
jgi:hypothetical protein